jgi:hypothetical protein
VWKKKQLCQRRKEDEQTAEERRDPSFFGRLLVFFSSLTELFVRSTHGLAVRMLRVRIPPRLRDIRAR